ncbi:mucin-7-like [Haliotis rufescens]|uniref:mucin-7-like n=1 Tax=Haliotis rufescens TaxID=6454 RepID=UPI001EB048E9|nr:mucin-7-like [Haliotis rufescens]
MARQAMSFFVSLLTLFSLSTVTEAACFQDRDKVIPMCESKTITGSTLYIEANTTVQGNELCSCTATSSRTGEVEIYAIVGTTFSDCSVRVDVYERMSSQDSNIYSIHCLQDASYSRSMAANTEVMYNLTGPGTIDSCVMMRTFATGSTITITCSPKIQVATTIAPSTTPAPTTQAATTPAPTTQAPTTQGPTQSPGPTTQAPVTSSPTTQAPSTPGPTTQAPTTQAPSTQAPITQAPSTQAPTTQAPTTQAPSTQAQTTKGPTTQAPPTQAPTGPTPTSSTPVAGSTQSLYDKFPVPEVAGGVAAGIVVIILLVIIITCCTSRNRSEGKSDEEMLRGRESPDTEMTEKQDGDGYAFDNILYHATNSTGKSVTPTVSDADTQDYQATKGLEELYASVNKTITDSTDIM